MSAIEELALVIGMMLVTFGVRYPVLHLAGKFRFPPFVELCLKFVPVAVLSAISVPLLLKPEGSLWLSLSNDYLVAGTVAVLTAVISRHLLATISVGMILFIALRLS